MKIVKYIVVLFSILSYNAIAQGFIEEDEAENQFYKMHYKNAVKLYENAYKGGDTSYKVISRIADAYYFNSDIEKAGKWYDILYSKYGDKINDDHLFRYAHTLKGQQKYQDADQMIKKMSVVNRNAVLGNELLEHPEYYTKYKNHKYKVSNVKNLDINTEYSDFGAGVLDEQLYFASTNKGVYEELYKWNEQPFLNLYTTKLTYKNKNTPEETLELTKATLLDEPVRTKYHESNAVITKDGKTMYFTRDNFYNGEKKKSTDEKVLLKLYKASLVDGKWTNIKELPFNSDEYSVGHPALSPDEKQLYFVSNMPEGLGGSDIYRVEIKANDTYGKPENLGVTINTKDREMFPFISEDNTLYFASDGHLGLGGLDIFEAPIVDGEFGVVENLQVPFNSNLDDFAFYIDKDNKRGFFSSNRQGGKGDDDIYSFLLGRKKKRLDYDCKKLLLGFAVNQKTGQVLEGAQVEIFDEDSNKLVTLQTSQKGEFHLPVNCMSSFYKLRGTKEGFKEDVKEVNSEDIKNVIRLQLEPIRTIAEIEQREAVIRTIYFNFNKSGIREGDSRPELDRIVAVMKEFPTLVIRIESHTDSRGSEAYNLKLSDRRAKSTRDYIISQGIAPERIASAEGFGETKLVNNCGDQQKCTEEEHQANRRSYFIIVKGGENVKVESVAPAIIDKKH